SERAAARRPARKERAPDELRACTGLEGVASIHTGSVPPSSAQSTVADASTLSAGEQRTHSSEGLLDAPARIDPSSRRPQREHLLDRADQLPRLPGAHEAVVAGLLGTVRALPSALQSLGESVLVEEQSHLHEPGLACGGELLELVQERDAGEVLAEHHVMAVGQVLADHRRREAARLES